MIEHHHPLDGPNTLGRRRRDRRVRRGAVAAVVLALLVATFVLVTGETGFPGPGSLRRYPNRDLQALADRINRLECGTTGPVDPQNASVDRLRSRVTLTLPWTVVVSPVERPMIENPGPQPIGSVTSAPAAACPSSTLQG